VRTIPAVRELYHTYQDDGLVIIGVHTPEFDFEKDLENVKQALVSLDVPYPVAIDNDWKIWRSYRNRYWPAQYIIDKGGDIREIHIGELHIGTSRYDDVQTIIQALLVEDIP
jgi:alkyl hydroperoxide reductase subunit AhpC